MRIIFGASWTIRPILEVGLSPLWYQNHEQTIKKRVVHDFMNSYTHMDMYTYVHMYIHTLRKAYAEKPIQGVQTNSSDLSILNLLWELLPKVNKSLLIENIPYYVVFIIQKFQIISLQVICLAIHSTKELLLHHCARTKQSILSNFYRLLAVKRQKRRWIFFTFQVLMDCQFLF